MILSRDRILTTHVGSLPRNDKLSDLLVRQEQGQPFDAAEMAAELDKAVAHVVGKQAEAGIDIGNDGEQQRVGFQTYVPQRMSGFAGVSNRRRGKEFEALPEPVARPASWSARGSSARHAGGRLLVGARRLRRAVTALVAVPVTALTLLAGADALARRIMYRIEFPERATYEEAERIARRALGPGPVGAQTTEAERLTLASAIELASDALVRVAHGAPPAMTEVQTDVPLDSLTIREHQVLALMAQRYTDKEIAQTLEISVRTVSRHVSNIFAKLGLRSRRDITVRFPARPNDR